MAAQVSHHDLHSSTAQLENYLAACAARWNWQTRIGDHCNADEIARALGDRLAQRHLFSAQRRAIAGIFNVAARERPAICAFDYRADFEIGVGRASILSRLSGHFDQFV